MSVREFSTKHGDAAMETLQDLSIKPLDLILFRGRDSVSKAMGIIDHENDGTEGSASPYSHAGLAITREALDLPFLEPGRIYVWESVSSAKKGFRSSVRKKFSHDHHHKDDDADQQVNFSVQLRDLELVIKGYYEAGGQVAWSSFLGKRPQSQELQRRLMDIRDELPQTQYSKSFLKSYGIVYPEKRSVRDRLHRSYQKAENIVSSLLSKEKQDEQDEYLYTSELCARVYTRLGLVDIPDNKRTVTLADFLSHCNPLVQDPVPILPEGTQMEQHEEPRNKKNTAIRRSAQAARLTNSRHSALQERLHEYMDVRVSAVTPTDDGGINIDFRKDMDADEELASRECIEEDARLAHAQRALSSSFEVYPPPLSIAILIVGTRGDVQPFIGIGKRLQRDGHRVRLAAHAVFRDFVESNGLEFYPLAGDPKQLMSYIIRTKGRLLPLRPDLLLDDVPKQRKMLRDIIESTWGACTAPDPDREEAQPFTADAIVSNPVTYGHVHVAEALNVPLQMIFTMPWSATRLFPHAMARLDFQKMDALENYISYGVVDHLLWAGTADLINPFREEMLGLPPISPFRGPRLLKDRAVPFCYLWSPSLVPTPDHWPNYITVADFVLADEKIEYDPPADLVTFLENGSQPIYVGFGSCVVEDPDKVSKIIFEALEAAGRRGIVAKGWGGLGATTTPGHVYLIGNCPHQWLFPRCVAVCHHGGAGTTATGLRAGRPTIIVPFFGDQPFWAAMIERSGAGPPPVPIDKMSVERLANAFRSVCEVPEFAARAEETGKSLRSRDGADLAAKAFYHYLPSTAFGAMCILGFDRDERRRIAEGESVIRDYCESSGKVGILIAEKIDRPLEDVFVTCLEGRITMEHPTTLSFGEVTVTDRDHDQCPTGFSGLEYTSKETCEVAALLRADTEMFNLSPEEVLRFQNLGRKFPAEVPSSEAIAAVNETLREILFERLQAYRQGGIDAIAPYMKPGGGEVHPSELLRDMLPSGSKVAGDLSGLYQFLLDHPETTMEPESRFFWNKLVIDGHPSFALWHNAHFLGPSLAVFASRVFYVGRGLDVGYSGVYLVPSDDDGTLVFSSGRMKGSKLVASPAERERTRSKIKRRIHGIMHELRGSQASRD